MNQLIRFLPQSKIKNNGKIPAQICLDGNYETFELNTSDWSKEDYINQWKHAVKISLTNRHTTALIRSLPGKTESGIKQICINTIIPEEYAYPYDFWNKTGNDFYITESFRFVTDDMTLLNDDSSFELINKSMGNYFPIYYFHPAKLERFYLYLSKAIQCLHWKVTREELSTVLDL